MRLLHRGIAALCAPVVLLIALSFAIPAQAACPAPRGSNGTDTELSVLKELCGQVEAGVGLKGGNFHLAPTLTVDAGAYAAGDALTDLITATGAARTNGGTGAIDAIDISSAGGSTNTIWIYAWDKQPAATCTKNAAFAPSATDNAYKLPGFPMSGTLTTNGLSVDTRTRIQLSGFVSNFDNQDSSAGTAIYFCLVTAGSVTPAATTDLSIVIGGLRD